MIRYTVVLPYAYEPYMLECRATMAPEFEAATYFVDDTDPARRKGIMRAHNMGIDHMMQNGHDWLIILSAAVRFGERGGLDFVEELGNRAGHNVVEAAGVFGWHLLAFSRDTLLKVGRWDENFSPYGFDDLDYSLRIQKAYNADGRQTQTWEKAPVDAKDTTMGHSIKLAGVVSPAESRIDYFTRKWGRHPGDWQADSYEHPFNDPARGLDWFPSPPDERVNPEAWSN